jgi:hypothetical protein
MAHGVLDKAFDSHFLWLNRGCNGAEKNPEAKNRWA